MSKDINLSSYEHIWTAEFNDYALVKQGEYGHEEYVICHLPSKTFLIIEDDAEDQAVIDKMLEMNMTILDIKTLRKK